jgi:hypothetical protein
MLKNKSYFRKSTGDEAGSAPKKNVITSRIKGKAYFVSWSMNVMVEGENVVRHMDLTTHNHGSLPAGAPATLHQALAAMGKSPACRDNKEAAETACNPWEEKAKCPEETERRIRAAERKRNSAKKKHGKHSAAYQAESKRVRDLYMAYAVRIDSNECRRVLRCVLIPFNKIKTVKCKKQTGDHLVEDATVKSLPGYRASRAPTAIVDGPSYHIGTHGIGHTRRTMAAAKRSGNFTLKDAAEIGASELRKTFPNGRCDQRCIFEQLIAGHKNMDIKPSAKADKPTLHSHHNTQSQVKYDAFNVRLALRSRKG